MQSLSMGEITIVTQSTHVLLPKRTYGRVPFFAFQAILALACLAPLCARLGVIITRR